MENYNDIINLPHHVSKKHPQMSLEQRSAQFAPFAALTGYEGQINETARLTNCKIELDEEEKIILDSKIQIIKDKIKEFPEITITYFVPDLKKDGGEYIEAKGIVKKIDIYSQKIIFTDGLKVSIDDILDIESEYIDKIF